VVGVGVGYIGKNNTTISCAACGLKLEACALFFLEKNFSAPLHTGLF